MGANFPSTTSYKASAIVLAIAALVVLDISTGHALEELSPHSSWQPADEWPCKPVDDLGPCQDWCKKIGEPFISYRNGLCCCLWN
ncbi:unnamed protein product [Urochloa decumbens]|uniref:Uncharacterized protein n=1 Tax=Urochloa decumbens TaxID=240449 RepID=A0ABC9B421_9POAL